MEGGLEGIKTLAKYVLLKFMRMIEPHCHFYFARENQFYPFINPIVGVRIPPVFGLDAKEIWAFGLDKIQIGMTQLISNELHQKNIMGAIAEVGVFRGINASVLNLFFPDRKLYLFDTFEGFDARDLETEKKLGFDLSQYPHRDFINTNVDLVMSRMSHKEKVIVRKGWFPESALGLEDVTFCYVFLDANLYNPIYEGLRWFYPRLANGGYILVDLYNWNEYPGPRKAVCDFSRESGVNYIPVPSMTGTVAFGKPLMELV